MVALHTRRRIVGRACLSRIMDNWPFVGTEAIESGVATKRTLHSRYEMIYRNVYVPKGVDVTPADRAVAAWLWSNREATVAGLSAAALFGTRWMHDRRLSSSACGVSLSPRRRERRTTWDGVRG